MERLGVFPSSNGPPESDDNPFSEGEGKGFAVALIHVPIILVGSTSSVTGGGLLGAGRLRRNRSSSGLPREPNPNNLLLPGVTMVVSGVLVSGTSFLLTGEALVAVPGATACSRSAPLARTAV